MAGFKPAFKPEVLMLCIPDNIKICYFNNDAVILDLELDEFFIVNDVFNIIEPKRNENDLLETLCNQFSIKKIPSLVVDQNDGYFEVRWLRPFTKKQKISKLTWLWFFIKMKSLVRLVDKGGISAVKKTLSTRRKCISGNTQTPDVRILAKLNLLINSFMRFYKFENPCLIYSFIMTYMLVSNGYDARVAIGVRTGPFFSHAWVEIGGQVYGDDQHIRKKLSVIMEL